MNRLGKRVAAAAAIAVFGGSLAACTDDDAPTPAPTPSVSISVSVSPGPTVYTSSPAPTNEEQGPSVEPTDDNPSREPSDEDTDEPVKPKASEDNIRLSGTIIYVNRAQNGKGKCGRVLDVVVDTSADDVRGIQAVHFHDEDGITILPEYRQIGDPLDIVIPPEDFKPLLLENGKEPFPPASDLTRCDSVAGVEDSDGISVLDPFYGQWIIRDLPYNGLTWRNP